MAEGGGVRRWLIIVGSYVVQAVCLVINVTGHGWIFGLSVVLGAHLVAWAVAYAICGREAVAE